MTVLVLKELLDGSESLEAFEKISSKGASTIPISELKKKGKILKTSKPKHFDVEDDRGINAIGPR